jgi:hypothetical protein
MARIHGISGSTRLLLNGTRPIHGRRLSTLEDITRFLDNYQEILAEAEIVEEKRQDEIIQAMEDYETELNRQREDAINNRTRATLLRLSEINNRIEASESFFVILGLLIWFWGVKNISSSLTHLPPARVTWNLWRHKKQKEKTIAGKPETVRNACKDIAETEQFLSRNRSFLIGAKAEEQVTGVLSGLPEDYHIMNGVDLRRFDTAYWGKRKDSIRYQQIDPVVIGPTGLFLIGTKSWTGADIELKTGDIKRQVRIATHALWCYMKDEYRFYEKNPKILCAIVSLQGTHPDLKIDKDIDVITLNRLLDYITDRESTLSTMNAERLTHVIPFREAH